MFNPQVWGTVSDWCMVTVTIATAYYLYKTLQSQKEVQKTQNELFRIESIRFKESIKPVLKYTGTTEMFTPNEDNAKVLTLKVTNESNSAALEISKVLKSGGPTHQIFIPLGYDDRRKHLNRADNPLLYHFLIRENSGGIVMFALEYKDVSGAKYKQGVFCVCDEEGLEIHPFLPEVIPE